jgi:four helix bundle protein
MAFSFEKLLVYQKSVAFADAVIAGTRPFPRGYFFLRDQLNRAALSIATNLAEGNGRFTVADRRQSFGIARGSVRECVPLLEVARRRELLPLDVHARLRADLEEITRMVSGLIKGLETRERGQPTRH